MIVMLGNWCGPAFRQIVAERDNIGQLLSPVGWRQPQSPHWACDNDVYGNRDDPDWWFKGKWKIVSRKSYAFHEIVLKRRLPSGEAAWRGMLAKVIKQPTRPMFVLLPDVVGEWKTTLQRAEHYVCEVSALHLPYAIALQDGCSFADVLPLKPDFVFIGGSTAWKWANVEPAVQFFQPLGIRVHVGRASGPMRIRECLRAGVDSCDGTGWGRASDKMLPGLWRELDGTHPQTRLEI